MIQRKVHSLDYQYSVDRIEITQVETIEDFGVTFDAKLSFTIHLSNLILLSEIPTRNFSTAHAPKTLSFSYVR